MWLSTIGWCYSIEVIPSMFPRYIFHFLHGYIIHGEGVGWGGGGRRGVEEEGDGENTLNVYMIQLLIPSPLPDTWRGGGIEGNKEWRGGWGSGGSGRERDGWGGGGVEGVGGRESKPIFANSFTITLYLYTERRVGMGDCGGPMGPIFLVRIGQALCVSECTRCDWNTVIYWYNSSVNHSWLIRLSFGQGLGSRDGLVLENGQMGPIFLCG